jgi:hypothetical protein
MLWFLKIFSSKNLSNILAFFWLKLQLVFEKNIDHNIGLWDKGHFFAKNWQKWQKIVIITSTPVRIILYSLQLRFPYFSSKEIQTCAWKIYGKNTIFSGLFEYEIMDLGPMLCNKKKIFSPKNWQKAGVFCSKYCQFMRN